MRKKRIITIDLDGADNLVDVCINEILLSVETVNALARRTRLAFASKTVIVERSASEELVEQAEVRVSEMTNRKRRIKAKRKEAYANNVDGKGGKRANTDGG